MSGFPNPANEVPDSGSSLFHSTSFGTDKDSTTHCQPAPPAASNVLPGENRSPRWDNPDLGNASSFPDGTPTWLS